MKTVRVTLDADLVASVDRAARRLRLSRSAFTRRALADALHCLRLQDQRRHREGYRRRPARRGEFDSREGEQVWPD